MFKKIIALTGIALLLTALAGSAETYTKEASNRVKINLGATPWKFIKSDPATAKDAAFVDGSYLDVGIPYTWADTECFLNEPSGGGDGSMEGGPYWYRKHFTLDAKYSDRKIVLEFEGVHVGCQVYVNGTFMPTTSAINTQATHVLGFTGFALDITPNVQFGGTDNVIAVRVSKSQGFYSDPGFSLVFRFGQGTAGIFRPVWLHITDKVHVPLNVYSGTKNWGTLVGTDTVADDGSSAGIKIQTNVQNESAAAANVTLTTKVVDATNTVVLSLENTQAINAGQSYVFDQSGTIQNPKLWYPNNSIYGKPNMHRVYHIVKVGGVTVDVFESPLGIRVITWDKNFPYINGKKQLLWGASARYDYPALATALPPEVEWRDAKILTECGGNLWRPGHSPCSPGFVAACDAYGIMLIQPSGEGEGAFSGGGNTTLKAEIHRDMIIRDRNTPSILAWEVSNGPIGAGFAQQLKALSVTWDPIHTRAQADRTPSPACGDILACTLTGCEIGVKNQFPNNPAWGAEAWGKQSARFAYDYELAFAGEFIQNWRKSIQANCFGLAQWYLAETPGETGNFVEGTNNVRSFGSSMLDFNRIPKLLYYIYRAAWVPFSIKPNVALAHHWNRSGNIRVNAFSNCPKVRLLINGESKGEKVPNPWNGTGTGIDQNTTQLPFQCWWDVTWAAGTLRAEGLDSSGNVVCFDEKKTAGAPHHVVLSVEPNLTKPNGETFKFMANGSDAAIIFAKIVDADGNWCPTANQLITWSVAGPGRYVGGSDQLVTAGKPKSYHSPGDPELQVEAGMCKVAVRTKFTTGVVTVNANVAGLPTPAASTTFTVAPFSDEVPVSYPAKAATAGARPAISVVAVGGTIRYFVGSPANVAVQVLDANGRVVKEVPVSLHTKGWHYLPLSGHGPGNGATSNGVYFVRCAVDGKYQSAKRLICLQ